MQDTVYHGSPIDIQDAYLKPLGWSYHLKQNAVYLTESELMALNFALFWRINPEEVKEISFYDLKAKKWEVIYVIKSKDVLKGYVYEVKKPNTSPVEYIDEQTQDTVSEYKKGVKAIFAVTDEVEILKKHIVDYNYLKAQSIPIKIAVLKKQYDFQQATAKIQAEFDKINKEESDDYGNTMKKYEQVLEKYTDR